MNKAQQSHIKTIVHNIKQHAECIADTIETLEGDDIADAPVEIVEADFQIIATACTEIQRVLNNMIPAIPLSDSSEPPQPGTHRKSHVQL